MVVTRPHCEVMVGKWMLFAAEGMPADAVQKLF